MNLQPFHLENDLIKLRPLEAADLEILYRVASDPLLWEQHPERERYKRDVFGAFFNGAIQSGGAFLISDTATGNPIGSSRFYDYKPEERSIFIGYTFLARKYWGAGYNHALKSLMLNYAFLEVESVLFSAGAQNFRSRKAIEKLGARKISQHSVLKENGLQQEECIYRLDKAVWQAVQL